MAKIEITRASIQHGQNAASKHANCNFGQCFILSGPPPTGQISGFGDSFVVHKVSPMNNPLTIRTATENDAEAIASLIQSVAHYFLSDQSGMDAEGFLASLSQTAISGYVSNPAFCYIVGLLGNKLVGVAAIRDNKHVYHLFVSPEHQRHGAATQLWLHLKSRAIAAGNTAGFTVNSSLFAVPVYAHWGFVPTATPQEKNGISFQAMHLPN